MNHAIRVSGIQKRLISQKYAKVVLGPVGMIVPFVLCGKHIIRGWSERKSTTAYFKPRLYPKFRVMRIIKTNGDLCLVDRKLAADRLTTGADIL